MGKKTETVKAKLFGKLYVGDSTLNFLNFLAISTYVLTVFSVIVTMLCYIEAIQTFFIFPYAFFIGYAVVGGLLILWNLICAVIYGWRLRKITKIIAPPSHAFSVYSPPVFGLVVYILNTWALSSWCKNFSQGYQAGLAGGDPNPANAASNANPLIPSGDLTALNAWNFIMLLFTLTGLVLTYICVKASHAHMYPQRVIEKTEKASYSSQ